MEGDAPTNTVKEGTGGAKEGGGGILGALMVAAPTLSKGTTIMDEGATIEPVKVASALTSATEEAEISSTDEAGGGGEATTTIAVARAIS